VSLRRLRTEDGISLTVAVCSLALMLTLGGVAMSQTVNALSHAGRQGNVKRALQAADSALEAAIFRVERADLVNAVNIDPLNTSTVASQNCVVSSASVAGGVDLAPLDPATPPDPDGRKWCPPTDWESAGDGGRFSYRLSHVVRVGTGPCSQANRLSLDREIVAVGSAGPVTRRVKARMRAAVSLFSGAAVQSGSATQPLTMADRARVVGNVQANNGVTGYGTNVIGGSATAGPGFAVTGVTPVGTSGSSCQPLVLPQVDQGTARTANDNGAMVAGCMEPVTGAGVPCKPLLVTTGGVDPIDSRRILHVWGNGRAVLTGSTYSFCSIRLEQQAVLEIAPASATTRIFLDDPDNCRDSGGALLPGAGQITVDGQGRIVNCHLVAQPESLQLYAVGNASIPTTQTLLGAGVLSGVARTAACGASLPVTGEPLVLYAPNSTVELGGTTVLAGQVAGGVVHLSGDAAVQAVSALINLGQLGGNPVLPLYKPTDYVECTGLGFAALPANDPAQGC
jgi:hypothetical protein